MKLFEYNFYQFITTHPSLRKFVRLTIKSEVDPDFYLKPKEISFQDNLDPKLIDKVNVLRREFLAKTPGYFCIYSLQNMKIEINNYYKQRCNLPYGFANKYFQ